MSSVYCSKAITLAVIRLITLRCSSQLILKALNCLGLSLHLPDKIIDHVGQLLDLDILNVNTTVQFIHYLPYSVSGIPDEVNAFIQTINWVVLLTIDSSYLVVQHVDLRQELSPYGSGILGFPLAPLLALSLFRLEQPSLQQATQRTGNLFVSSLLKNEEQRRQPVKPIALQ
jgi:hypothetical protein